MNELQPNYEGMSKKELVSIIKSQKSELISQEAVIKEYKKHLEQVIEFSSVEKYQETVKRNREAAETAPQDSDNNFYDPEDECITDPNKKILREELNPHVRVEIESYGVKVVSDDWFRPIKEEAKVTFTVDLSELKRLLNKASDQVEQLQGTLDEIDKFECKPVAKQNNDSNFYNPTTGCGVVNSNQKK